MNNTALILLELRNALNHLDPETTPLPAIARLRFCIAALEAKEGDTVRLLEEDHA